MVAPILRRLLASATPHFPPSARVTSPHRAFSISSAPPPPSSSTTSSTSTTTLSAWLFFATPVVVTFSLGVWQLKRLSRKNQLIHFRHKQLSSAPVPLVDVTTTPASGTIDVSNTDFRTVRVRGRFLHHLEMLVSPRSAPKKLPPSVLQWGGSSGLLVITPCLLDSGHVVLVNRGWIPHRLVEGSKRPVAAVSPIPVQSDQIATSPRRGEGKVNFGRSDIAEFTAVIQLQQERTRFTPSNDVLKNEWFYIDVPQMLGCCGVVDEMHVPFVVELIEPLPSNGWPFPRDVEQLEEFRTPPSTHVTYAVTWFSLSVALALLTRFRMRRSKSMDS